MTDAVPLHRSQRWYVWGLLVVAFGLGVYAGLMLSTTWEVDRMARESGRRTAEALAQLPSRPTLHERLDVIEQRLQAIEQRLAP